MEREVGMLHTRLAWLTAILLVLLPPSGALVITPGQVHIGDYASPQELVITFYNDEYKPVMCDLTPALTSTYLLPYVSLEPSSFILQPDTQKNVKVTTSFPQQYPPQEHRFVMAAQPQGEEGFVISFRPPGEARQQLQLQNVHTELGEQQRTMTITLDLKNTGNVVLFVTPIILVSSNEGLAKNITYPRPVTVMPDETFPLTLRQDNSDLSPGRYTTVVKASYHAGGVTMETGEEVITFTIDEEVAVQERDSWWFAAAAFVSAGIVGGALAWLLPHRRVRRKRKQREMSALQKERHITPGAHDLFSLRKDVVQAREEVARLGGDIRRLVEEAEGFIKGGGRA